MNDARSLLLAMPTGATRLPADPALLALVDADEAGFLCVVASHPASPLAWALLAEGSLTARTPQGDLTAYAFARTGYHRGLDALRRAGWKGHGPVPWSHDPNRGFLRSVHALSRAAEAIGEDDEADRCRRLLDDSDPSVRGAIR